MMHAKPANLLVEGTLREADAAVQSTSNYKATAAERRLNTLGDRFSSLKDGSLVTLAQSDAAASTFSLIKEEVINFADTSKALMTVLDEVAKLHPFIQVAVSLFKTALTLELTRRENDEKVIALNATMCDMMSVLTIMKDLPSSNEPDSHGFSLEDRLLGHMHGIVQTIKDCAKVCDSYHKHNLAVKILTSAKWQAKFTQIAQQFVSHKAELQFDLQMHTSLGVAATRETLRTVGDDVGKVMDMVFTLLRSPAERELANFIESRPGGIEGVLRDDNLLKQVIAKQKPLSDVGSMTRLDTPLTIEILHKEIDKDIDSILRENQFFDQKFEAMHVQLQEVKETVKHETDRAIRAILSGPHERIIDQDLCYIWHEMTWKGSVKAKHLVMAIRDHFSEENSAGLTAARRLKLDANGQSTAPDSPSTARPDEAWTLQYITVSRVRPLIEAIDDDLSSFVTVSEVNAFTSARPASWSLPRWVAYWTYGFEMTLHWYLRRIRALFAIIDSASHTVLPANRSNVGDFLSSPQICFVENLLSGLQRGDGQSVADWDWDTTFSKFKDYIVGEEDKLAKRLRSVKYVVDETNTLTVLVTGCGRPEKYVLPMVLLLLRRSLFVIRQASTIVLHPKELYILQSSIQALWGAVADRIGTLRAMFKFQNLNGKTQLENFCFGLYSHVLDEVKMSPYWHRDPSADLHRLFSNGLLSGDQHLSDIDSEDEPLCYSPQVETMDVVFNADATPHDLQTACETLDASKPDGSIVGHWGGSYTYGNGAGHDGLVSFTISDQSPDGIIDGYGKDAWGPFSIRGSLSGDRIAFLKTYAVLQNGGKVIWYYEGQVHDSMDTMDGSWGLPQSLERFSNRPFDQRPTLSDAAEFKALAASQKLVPLGSFDLKRRPLVYFLACPPADYCARSRVAAWWTLALNTAIYNVRSRRLDWDTLLARRRSRRRYLELKKKHVLNNYWLDAEDSRERDELLKNMHPDDLHAWNALVLFQLSRDIIHSEIPHV
ncbi:hypothetical protein C8Q79DRAFT_730049 [Trametes meyenii]|nr:hypothetical protein C8Q79DRAFT_730049 [Trametes meyenii]